jgi:formylmethanofuran dehydrogenase subunit D
VKIKKLNKVHFGTTKIQKMRRITLDPNLMKTLDLAEGDSVSVSLVVSTGEICIEKVAVAAPKQSDNIDDENNAR